MKRLLTILCLLIPFLGVKAGTLKGKIIDQDAQPVAGAVITYYSYSDNSILASTTCNVNGNWELSYEEAWNNIHIVARAEGYTSYTFHGFNVSMNHTWPKIIFHLFNAIDYKAGKRSTIYLPETPDASWGRFYRLDHEDGNKVVFEREYTPKAYVPYVFFPYQDLHIDISKMDLSDHHDQVRLEHISFSSAINYIEAEQPGSLVTQPMDETLPYAKYSEEGAIVDYLSPAPMHAILSWMWYDFFEGNEEDGTWQAVSPEFIFHDPEPTTYHPLAKEGKVWNFKMREYLNNGVLDHYYSYIVKGDTTIHEKAYKKLYMQYDKYNIYTAALRDEGSCAYIVPANTGSEFYYYDLELKERVPLTHGLDARPYKSPSTRDINGITLNCLEWLIGPTSVHMLFLWIEGIGCTQDFFKCHLFGPSDGGTVLGGYGELVSCIEDGVYLYGDETSVPVTTRTVIPLHYEGKDGYDGEASNIWLETDGTNITFFLHDVKDVFTLYLNNEPLQIDFTGDMFKSFVPSPLSVNYRMEGPNEIFSVDYHQPEDATYHPFVEQGKRWCVHGFSMGGQHTVTDYSFSDALEYISHDGHEYSKFLAWRDNQLTEVGEVREEDRRVYFYDTDAGQEYLIYDFSLEVGDTFKETRQNLIFTVDSTGQMVVNGDTLKTLHLSALDGVVTINWVEGVGNTNSPLENFYADTPVSWSYRVAYVSGSSYWPFSFSIPYNGWWGQNLTRGMENQEYARTHSFDENDLHYELVPDPVHDAYALHVSGIMWLYCGGDLYTYCRRERTEDISAYKLYLQEDVPGEVTTCKSPYHVDLSFPFFEAEYKYTVVDERGEHPVAVKDVSYRPLIEEGKVWRTGVTFPNISFSHLYDYYIQGDTIIDNHACKKLMRSELQYPQNYPEHIDTTYAASLYEEGQRVYVVLPGESHLELAYDFASPVGSHIDIDGFNIIVTRKEEKATGCFKGRCTYVGLEEEYEDISFESCWIEGVGVALNPLYSLNELLPTGLLKELLIFCFVNDEVLYYNSDIFDGDIYGLTPQAGEVKKQWIDFTHIKKPRPKAPARERTANETDEENLTGEYSAHELFVNLKILSGTYTVTLRDAADNEVYRKDVQTNSTIALNTDLTKYPAGTYTLVVENSEEQYTATLTLPLDDTAVRDIPSDPIVNNKSLNSKCFDLSGRQLSTPPAKGIYIRNGKKVVVK